MKSIYYSENNIRIDSLAKEEFNLQIKKRTLTQSLIILGGEYSFSTLELKTLQKSFNRVDFIKYQTQNLEEVRRKVNFFLRKKDNLIQISYFFL